MHKTHYQCVDILLYDIKLRLRYNNLSQILEVKVPLGGSFFRENFNLQIARFRLLTFTTDSWLTLSLAGVVFVKYIFVDSDPEAEPPKVDSSSQTGLNSKEEPMPEQEADVVATGMYQIL